ncbi:MAG: galactose-1-phosphate uridylyltransferase [Acidobacteria bacterium]|nr:galactose-1-phosphate uridylyltransferase [Acidobacteriota bacterium]
MELHLFRDHSHRRYNPLLREWMLAAPHLAQPLVAQPLRKTERLPIYDPKCALCPGNPGLGGANNPDYEGALVVDENPSPLTAASPDAGPDAGIDESNLIVVRNEPGACRSVAYAPRHNLSLARMELSDLCRVVELWTAQYEALGAAPSIRFVQLFEDHGEALGPHAAHPHCRLWATATLPSIPAREQAALAGYHSARATCLLCDYLALEQVYRERFVCENDHFTAVVPFWATTPYEVMLISRQHQGALHQLSGGERLALADVVKRLSARYENLFGGPVSLGFHQSPTDGHAHPEWHLHAHFFAPLPRWSPAGPSLAYDALASPLLNWTAEAAALRLREAPEAVPESSH